MLKLTHVIINIKVNILNSYNISRIIFFKKLHVIFNNIPHYLSKLKIEINEKKWLWCNFWDELHDDIYFNDEDGIIIIIKCIKLTNNMYEIKVPVINSPIPITSYIITD